MQDQSAVGGGEVSTIGTIDRAGAAVSLTFKEAEDLTGIGYRSIGTAARKGTLKELSVARNGRSQKGATLAEIIGAYPQAVESVEAGYREYLASEDHSVETINERMAGFYVLMETFKGGAVDTDVLAASMVSPVEEKHSLEMQLERERTAHEHSARMLLQRSLDDMRTMLRVENAQLVAATNSLRGEPAPAERRPLDFLKNRSGLAMIAGGIAGVAVVILVATMAVSITLSISDRWFAGRIDAMERTLPADSAQELMWSDPARYALQNLRDLKHAAESGRTDLGTAHTVAIRMVIGGFLAPIRTRIDDLETVLLDGSIESGGEMLQLQLHQLRQLQAELESFATDPDESSLDQRQLRACIAWIERLIDLGVR
jgi:hypothetical protein